MQRLLTSILTILFLMTSAHAADFKLTSTSFPDNTKIPNLYTCDGGNVSPQFSWQNVPANTQSFVLILINKDWLPMKIYLWVLYNIPASVNSLPENANHQKMLDGISIGLNYYSEAKYDGPCPPNNRSYHYSFTLYALNTVLDLGEEADPDDVEQAMQGHILKQAEYIGLYNH